MLAVDCAATICIDAVEVVFQSFGTYRAERVKGCLGVGFPFQNIVYFCFSVCFRVWSFDPASVLIFSREQLGSEKRRRWAFEMFETFGAELTQKSTDRHRCIQNTASIISVFFGRCVEPARTGWILDFRHDFRHQAVEQVICLRNLFVEIVLHHLQRNLRANLLGGEDKARQGVVSKAEHGLASTVFGLNIETHHRDTCLFKIVFEIAETALSSHAPFIDEMGNSPGDVVRHLIEVSHLVVFSCSLPFTLSGIHGCTGHG